MKLAVYAILAMLIIPLNSGLSADESATVIVRAHRLHTGTGEVLTPGSVLIRGGKIADVAAAHEVEGAKIIAVPVLIPGLVDAASRTGLGSQDAERTKELTPDLVVESVIDWADRDFAEQLSNGTTSVQISPGTGNVIAGRPCIAKTIGDPEKRVIVRQSGLLISVCSDPASGNAARSRPDSIYVRQPTNRMGVIWMLRSTFQATAAGKESSPVLQEVVAGKIPVFAVSRTQYDIQALMTVADEFGFHPILVGGQEAWQVTDELAAHKTSVILQRTTPGANRGDEGTRLCADNSVKLHAAGIPFCHAEGDLLDQARFAVRYGLAPEVALQSITSFPASILKIDDRVGSIAVGKDADLVAMDGNPLEFTTAIQWVMVDGAIQFEQAGN